MLLPKVLIPCLNLVIGKMESLLDVLMKGADYGDEGFISKFIINGEAAIAIAISISCLQPEFRRLPSCEAALRNRKYQAPVFGPI